METNFQQSPEQAWLYHKYGEEYLRLRNDWKALVAVQRDHQGKITKAERLKRSTMIDRDAMRLGMSDQEFMTLVSIRGLGVRWSVK